MKFLCIETIIIRFVLKKFLSKKCGVKIPRSGEEGDRVRCYVTKLIFSEEEQLLLTGFNDNGVEGLGLDIARNEYCMNRTVPWGRIRGRFLELRRYHGHWVIDYRGLRDLILFELMGISSFKIHVSRFVKCIAVFFYKRKDFAIKRRHEILRILISSYTEDTRKALTVFSIMELLHGVLWFRHPDQDEEKRRIEFYLDSLVQSGELKKDGLVYLVTGQAIVSLEQYEDSERRHAETRGLQLIMVMATIAMAVFTFLSLFK
ncbi:MAG: hypothetical protein HGA87_03885 [Desulfobulbaceae bacterium]|nr:hypothetical protein [Desulfobulbaceae bacterium]